MRRAVLLLLAMVGLACGTPAVPPPPPAVPAPLAAAPAPSDAAAPSDATAPSDAAPVPIDAAVGMITTEECVARGGRVHTERDVPPRRAYPDRKIAPFSVCVYPNPKVGHVCRGEADCGGARCMCTGALGRPNPSDDPALRALDQTAGTGVCSDSPLPDGEWFCMVEGGTIRLAGIIID